MSSDDQIIVREDKNRKYDVSNNFIEGGIIEKIGHFTNLREAMCAAEDYQKNAEVPVEYGITFIPYQKDDILPLG